MSKFKLKTIRAKLAVPIVISMTVGVGIFLVIIIPKISRQMESSAVERYERETLLFSELVDQEIKTIGEDIVSLSNTPPIGGMMRAIDNDGYDELEESSYEQWVGRLQDIFVGLAEAKSVYYQIRYIDENGDELVRVDYDEGKVSVTPEDELQNKSERYYFTEAIQYHPESMYVSQVDLNKEGNPPEIELPFKPVVRYAYPLFDNFGNRRGILIANVDADLYLRTLDDLENHEYFFVDKDGYYLKHAEGSKEWGGVNDLGTGENIKNDFPDEALNILSSDTGSIVNTKGLFLHSKIPLHLSSDQSIVMVRLVPLHEITSLGRSLSLTAIAVAVVVAGAIIASVLYFVSRFTEPINKLSIAAQRLGKGSFGEKVEVNSSDELGTLAQTFNKMSEKLANMYSSLDEKVKASTLELNKKVKETTTVNEELEKTKLALLNVLEDVEDEKDRAEDLAKDLLKFQLAVESTNDHVVITDPEGIVLYANPATLTITGYSREEAVGKKAGSKELWGGLMDVEFYKTLWKTIKVDKKSFVGEITNKRKNGQEYLVYATITPILDTKGDVEFFVGIERDITKEKEVDKAKTEFVSLASHQLRTPLSTINWYTELLLGEESGKINSEQKKYLNEVYTGSKRMVELVNALLNVSRLDMGTFAVDPVNTDVVKLISNVVKEVEPRVFKKKLELVEEYPSDGLTMKLDTKLFDMIVQNLLSNAIKYTPEEGKIIIRLVKSDENMKLSVSDTGMGIPNDAKDKIFSKLFRADNVREKDTTGTGLGLYIIKSIVEYVDGAIEFESEENKGTTFHVTLPLSGMKKKDGSKPLEEEK